MLNLVVEILEECKAEIQRNLAEQGVNASGRTSRGLVVEKYDGGVRLVATDGAPLFTTEIGRGPGKVPYLFADILFQWSKDKGLQFKDDKERKQFASALAWQIKKEGTQRHTNPSKQKQIYTKATEQALAKINELLPRSIKDTILKKPGQMF